MSLDHRRQETSCHMGSEIVADARGPLSDMFDIINAIKQ